MATGDVAILAFDVQHGGPPPLPPHEGPLIRVLGRSFSRGVVLNGIFQKGSFALISFLTLYIGNVSNLPQEMAVSSFQIYSQESTHPHVSHH